MPELPEVEVVRRGLQRFVSGKKVTGFVARVDRMKWPIAASGAERIVGSRVRAVRRRAKYLMLCCGSGTLVIHLGMSGSIRIVPSSTEAATHDHVDVGFGDRIVRLHDPRRFGGVTWRDSRESLVGLLGHLGVEPLSSGFDGRFLFLATRGLRRKIKPILLDQAVVAGIGNIYASESLFRAGVHPSTLGKALTLVMCDRLARAIKMTLRDAINAGGTSLRDFSSVSGAEGDFQDRAYVYGRAGLECRAAVRELGLSEMRGERRFIVPDASDSDLQSGGEPPKDGGARLCYRRDAHS